MGRQEWLTEDGWRDLREDGVTTVIDLRNEPERTRRPTDPTVGDAARAGVDVVHCPVEDQDVAEYMGPALAAGAPYPNHPRYYPSNLRYFPDRLARVFGAIAAAPGAVVLHCWPVGTGPGWWSPCCCCWPGGVTWSFPSTTPAPGHQRLAPDQPRASPPRTAPERRGARGVPRRATAGAGGVRRLVAGRGVGGRPATAARPGRGRTAGGPAEAGSSAPHPPGHRTDGAPD